MKKWILIIIVIVIASNNSYGQAGSKEREIWKKNFTKKGITVYTRLVSGSSLAEFKGIGFVNAPIEVCQNILTDIPSQPQWIPDSIHARILKKEKGGNIIIYYNLTNVQWPVSDRDIVTKSEFTIKKDRIIHNARAINGTDFVPLKSGNVRITKMNATWILIRKGMRTLVSYRVKADPGGFIPAWLANSASKKIPYKTLLGLRKMATLSKYKTKK